ncbi:hypothetical protein [Senegalia massiliensis]|uniref:hypothetical protein n=1 Tax=Senegalia massiliensis TaxID=1720316 RepID=UPI001362E2F0|nr:hypothetical protein [Senegalia massiliensis]
MKIIFLILLILPIGLLQLTILSDIIHTSRKIKANNSSRKHEKYYKEEQKEKIFKKAN